MALALARLLPARPGRRASRHVRSCVELIVRERLERRSGDCAIPLDVLRQVVGRAEVVVVAVQSIGHATEAAEALETADDVRLDRVARALDLTGVGGAERNAVSSSSIAFSSSSAVWPGRAVASIWNTDPRISEYCCAETFCAICFS